jgi:leucyl/phenylalanyl-tRNA--protein transferase
MNRSALGTNPVNYRGMNSPLYWVQANRMADDFPDTAEALAEPDGLLAAGGDLAPERLLIAYRSGIFPWFSAEQPILWWAPDPRSVMYPEGLKISRSLRKTLKRHTFTVTIDQAFDQVMRGCAAPRRDQAGTWITDSMIAAYVALHRHGYAHSIECWATNELVGGLYGVAIGQVFFGESMFSVRTDASKVAMATLANRLLEWGYRLIDCQVHNSHLASLGATKIKRSDFNALITNYCALAPHPNAWREATTL